MAVATTYAQVTTRVVDEATINVNSDTAWATEWPSMLADAELRILRKLDPLVARKYQQTTFPATVSARSRLLNPTGCIVMRDLFYFTPAGSTTKRNPIERKTETFCNDYWPDRTLTRAPRFFCDLAQDQILIVPTADDVYTVQMAFTFRPNSLSVDTGGTYISQTYPDLLFQACMVEVAGFKKNYGLLADDPQQGITWESRFKETLLDAIEEEGRRKIGQYADQSRSKPSEESPVR